ncbi:MAG: amidohydrolase, partial [Synergistes sp.]|nr:amidohydrolase [Synergistes sp.]
MTRFAVPPALSEKMREWRRDLHRYPERGWAEFRTTAKIAAELRAFGVPFRFLKDFLRAEDIMGRDVDVRREHARAAAQGAGSALLAEMGAYTGLAAELDTGRPGPSLLLRFDVDCVECEEAKDKEHLPARCGFASENPGLMHACAHDGHAAVGIALAELLTAEKEKLCGKVTLLFQPAEEGVRGGYAAARSGIADGADCFIALHLGLGRPAGTVVCGMGGFLFTTKFDAVFTGQSAHAG